MTRRLRVLDRLLVGLVGLLLLGGAALTITWNYDLAWSLPRRLDLSGLQDVLRAGWWPWTFGVASVVLGLLGLLWVLAHAPRPAGRTVRTLDGDDTGTSRLDLSAVATAVAARFEDLAPVASASGSYQQVRGTHVVTVRAGVDERTSAEVVSEALRTVDAELQAAFEGDSARLRVLLGAPRRLPALTRSPAGTGPMPARPTT